MLRKKKAESSHLGYFSSDEKVQDVPLKKTRPFCVTFFKLFISLSVDFIRLTIIDVNYFVKF